jgi:hypothetical protein
MIAITAVLLLAAIAVALTPSASAADDTFNTYADIRAESYVAGVGKTIEYTIYAADDTSNDISFAAKLTDEHGNTVSRVSPSSGRSIDSDGTSIMVTAPGTPGSYRLVVDFSFTNSANETKTVTKTAPLKVVVPITLSAKLVNNSGTITSMSVWFVVHDSKGERIGDEQIGEQTVRIDANSSQTVTYEWITEKLSNGKYTVELSGEVGPVRETVNGLDVPSDFYVGQTSYTMIETILVILLIVLVAALFFILRKPVKNVGKPKGRR